MTVKNGDIAPFNLLGHLVSPMKLYELLLLSPRVYETTVVLTIIIIIIIIYHHILLFLFPFL